MAEQVFITDLRAIFVGRNFKRISEAALNRSTAISIRCGIQLNGERVIAVRHVAAVEDSKGVVQKFVSSLFSATQVEVSNVWLVDISRRAERARIRAAEGAERVLEAQATYRAVFELF